MSITTTHKYIFHLSICCRNMAPEYISIWKINRVLVKMWEFYYLCNKYNGEFRTFNLSVLKLLKSIASLPLLWDVAVCSLWNRYVAAIVWQLKLELVHIAPNVGNLILTQNEIYSILYKVIVSPVTSSDMSLIECGYSQTGLMHQMVYMWLTVDTQYYWNTDESAVNHIYTIHIGTHFM